MEIEHFSHEHLLSLSEKKREDEVLCKACNIYCVGPTFSCRELCGFGLHESCAKLPQELHNPLHPHALSLHPQYGKFKCNACAQDCSGFTFRCDKCDVNLDLTCAFIRPAIEEREEPNGTHFSHHQHPLLLLEKIPAYRINCRVCGTYCSDPTYGCFPCRFFLHRSCFERKLPQETQHFYHPCPLILYTTGPDKSSPCRACRQFFPRGAFYYGCSRCHFVMDIDCTLLPTTQSKSDQEEILHFLHGHPLSLSKIKADHKVHCYVCGKGCTDPTYACGRRYCKYVYFHKSCLELPQEIICHPFHPHHPLTLELLQYGGRCNACRKDIRFNNSAYVCQCNNCRFFLHIECSVIMPAIKFEGHDHLLQFRDKIENIPYIGEKCRVCNLSCESYAFSCLYCDFNLHLMCGPLPYSINHKCHIDPIVFTSSPVEDEEDCKSDEFYCDACEEEIRDTLLPIYYCKECPFVAEISCVISEVVSLLKGEHGDVELRNLSGQFGKLIREKEEQLIKPALTLYDILKSLSEEENEELSSALRARGRETITTEEILCNDHDEVFWVSDKAYTEFMKFLDIGTEIPTEFRDGVEVFKISDFMFRYRQPPEEEVVNIGDYMVTRKLAPILKGLLSKHGDVSAESKLSPRVKLYFFHMLCESIYSMINTRVVDITKDDLLKWWTSLKTSQFAGFRIQFAFDHLKRVAHAHFGLYVEKQETNALDKLDRDIKKLYKDIEALKGKRERISSVKSSLIEECLREASVMRQGKAGVGLL